MELTPLDRTRGLVEAMQCTPAVSGSPSGNAGVQSCNPPSNPPHLGAAMLTLVFSPSARSRPSGGSLSLAARPLARSLDHMLGRAERPIACAVLVPMPVLDIGRRQPRIKLLPRRSERLFGRLHGLDAGRARCPSWGQKRKWHRLNSMSVLPSSADITRSPRQVRFVP
jgi:hypothetical protein